MTEKKKQDKLQQLPSCAAEFIKQVINRMRYRQKVRQEVQEELAAHFEDELKDCSTDEEKTQKAENLITDFGNAKMLAVLLRRAKKRCRPLWRIIVARTFQTAGVLILCFIVYVGWFFTGRPVINNDYLLQLNLIAQPVADQKLNSAPLYDEAAQLVESMDPQVRAILGNRFEQSTTKEKELMAKWLSENNHLFELLINGTKKPYYWHHYEIKEGPSNLMANLVPTFQLYKSLAYALRWRAFLAVEQGKHEEAFDDLVACFRFASHIRKGTLLIEQLVGIAIEAFAVGSIQKIVNEHQISQSFLTLLQNNLEDAVASEKFTLNLEGEKLFSYDIIQRCFTEDLAGGHILPKYLEQIYPEATIISTDSNSKPPSVRTPLVDVAGIIQKWFYMLFLQPDKKETREDIQRFYNYFETIADKTPATIRAEGRNVEQDMMNILGNNLLRQEFAPSIASVNLANYRSKTETEATLTIMAILRHKLDKGEFPESLVALVNAGYLKNMPIDPFSNNPLAYKQIDDDFILYSYGTNYIDDGGQMGTGFQGRPKNWAENGDSVFWPVYKAEKEQ
jgi:hypothetical protein